MFACWMLAALLALDVRQPAHAAPAVPPAVVPAAVSAAVPAAVIDSLPAIPLVHTRWSVREGVPPGISWIAQTPDGWLWLASPTGLYRFDGIAFSRYQPPAGIAMPGNIQKIGTLADGTLWVAPFFGGLHLIKGDDVRTFGKADGLPIGVAGPVALGADGRLWLASSIGLHVLEPGGKQWRNVGEALGLPGPVRDLSMDSAGTLWTLGDGIGMLRSGATAFTRVDDKTGNGELRHGPDGALWAFDPAGRGMQRLTPGPAPDKLAKLLDRIVANDAFIDRKGDFWFTAEEGVLRIAMGGAEPALQSLTVRQGLSGHFGKTAFEDREGNVWIATEGGLDQFRPGRMRAIALPPYLSTARPLAAGDNGRLWVDYAYLASTGAAPEFFGTGDTAANLMATMYRDPHGTVWYSVWNSLWKLEGRKPVQVPSPKEIASRKSLVMYTMAMDADDGLWVSYGPRGTWRLKDGQWTQAGGIAALTLYATTTLAPGPDRSLWFGSVNNSLAILRAGKVTKLGAAQGIDVGSILQILPDATGAWLSGDAGLARYDGQRARRIVGEGGELFPGATGLVLAADGALWANTGAGLLTVAAAELQRAAADPAYRVQFRRYDENDGLIGTVGNMLPLPSMVRTTDGELVISTSGGVFRYDPVRMPGNRLRPPVHITGIAANGILHRPGPQLALPAAPGEIRIDYTALSLVMPQRVRFRTMLEGVDTHWQEAGNRRAAFYTQLAPGTYTFRVKAANDDGVWNEEGARLQFAIPPTLTQTVWFKLGCALLALLAAFGLHRMRLAMTLRRMTRTLEARAAERERIARDLHDTLLQSVQGLILQFHRIVLQTPAEAPTRPAMLGALSDASEVLKEGRDKVGGLRVPNDGVDLAEQLAVDGQRLAEQHGGAFFLRCQGARHPLRAAVQEEILAIGREAIRNACMHAQAGRIDVTLHFSEHVFELTVQDDGTGICETERAGRAGHWGIPGMRERAAELGATLTLQSAAGQGTAWHLQLGAALAYADADNTPGDAVDAIELATDSDGTP